MTQLEFEIQSAPLEQLFKLTDLAEIRRQLLLVEQEEIQLDQHLDTLLQKSSLIIDEQMQVIDSAHPRLSKLSDQVNAVHQVLDKTASLAEAISVKVKSLDLEQRQVQYAIRQVEEAQELKNCITGVQQALKVKDYENAAEYVSSYLRLQISQTLLQDSIISIDADDDTRQASTVSDASNIMNSAKKELLKVCDEKFEEALTKSDEKDMLRYWKLYPKLGHADIGLDKLCSRLCSSIRKSFPIPLNMGDKGGASFVDVLTALFELLAKVIDQQTPLILEHYGAGYVIYVIRAIEVEASFLACKILSTFSEKRNIDRKMKDIEILNSNRGSTDELVKIDLRELSGINDDIAFMAQRIALFNRFLRNRAQAAQKVTASTESIAPSDKHYDSDGLLKVNEMNQRIRELLSAFYVSFESHFLTRAVNKALRADQYDSNVDEHLSSCVDDCFFIFKKVVSRALASEDVNTTCVALNLLCRSIDCDYFRDGLQHRLLSSFGGEKAFGLQERADAKIGYMILLNDLEASKVCLSKLVEEVRGDSQRLSVNEKDKEKIESCLLQFQDSTGHFSNLLRTGLDNLFTQCMRPKLRQLSSEVFTGLKYVIQDSGETQSNDTPTNLDFIDKYTRGLSRLLADGYQKFLVDSNFTALIQHVTEYFVKDWERCILNSATFRFNVTGAHQFDKDIRKATSYFATLVKKGSVRSHLLRLSQISMLVNLEKAEEVADYLEDSSRIRWCLNAAEIRKVLSLRFPADQVAKVQL